ncbi:MAG TPA: SUMF1/EgtB/PvdO family nonheme iron enzyme, partial [Candidatus Acidoferrum sp.]|nr:SUMF1/EgtB/PvdO family nonheme iron enzyme [Candidatus Acidoferrum sp.]
MRSILLCSAALTLLFISHAFADAFHPGQVFRDCPDCPEMVVIPGGNFLMGAPLDEPGRDDIEGPQRRVTIAQFAAGKYDVTRAQWKAFAKDTNRKAAGGCAWTPSNQDLNPDASWE